MELIAEASNGEELVELVRKYDPEIVLTDIQMPIFGGAEAIRIIKEINLAIGIIAFSAFENQDYILTMVQAGVDGYLLKTSGAEEIILAIHSVRSGGVLYSEKVSETIRRYFFNVDRKKNKPLSFSSQEIKVMELVCNQYISKEIATSMKLSVRAIKDQRKKLFEKIGARNIVGVALYALLKGIVKGDDIKNTLK